MTLSDNESKVSLYTNTTSSVYTAAQRLIDLNLANNEVEVEIWKASPEWDFDDSNKTNLPIYTGNLKINQPDYALPTDARRIKRIEITYDGTNWYKANPLDLAEVTSPTDTTSISNDFSQNEPFYDIIGNSVFFYPIPDADVTSGLKIVADRDMYVFTSTDVTGGTKSFGFDLQFHRAVPMIMSREWFMSKDLNKVNLYEGMIDKVKQEIRTHYTNKQQDRRLTISPAIQDYA